MLFLKLVRLGCASHHETIAQFGVGLHTGEQVVVDVALKLLKTNQSPAVIVPLCRIGERTETGGNDGLLEIGELVLAVAALRFAVFTGSGFNYRRGSIVIAEIEMGRSEEGRVGEESRA